MSRKSTSGKEGGGSPLFTPENFEPGESIGYLMRLVISSMKAQIEQAMEPHELTAMQWQPLYMIAQGLATTPAELARRMQVDTGAVTRMVDRMEHKGLVERSRSQQDRRVVNLRITDSGREAASVVPGAMCAVLNEHLQGFTPDEVDTLKHFLQRMLENGANAGYACLPDTHQHATSKSSTVGKDS